MDKLIDTITGGLSVTQVDESQIRWQNGLVGKLHALTGSLLFLFSVTLFAKELLGEHIKCTRHDTDTSFISESTFNSYCYITDTFTLAEEQFSGAHPGVGPGHKNSDHSQFVYHSYYQWVPFLLLIQAASFYVPYLLYKFSHDNRIPHLIQDLQNTKPFNEIRDDKIGDIHIYLQDFYGSHGPWAYKLVLSDFLNLVNLILNILFLQWYLRGQFIDYGIEFLAYQLAEIKVRGMDPFNVIFPKMTKCNLQMYGPSGSIMNYDGLCVLPVNVLNEKIFLIVWAIFLPLLIITMVEQCIWLIFILHKPIRNQYLMGWIMPPTKYRDGENKALKSKQEFNEKKERAKDNLKRVMKTIGFPDWMVLYMVARNIDRALFTQLAACIDPPGFGYYAQEDEDSDENI